MLEKWIFISSDKNYQGQQNCPCSLETIINAGYKTECSVTIAPGHSVIGRKSDGGCQVILMEDAPSWMINKITRYFDNLLK